ncbi:MAG: hypothetical protein JWO14_2210 [Solirubrobacterales bacterium]|nr:hypothetical protein [Solirubrobacterales bacterium]
MSTPQPHAEKEATPKQLRYLRDLALKTGQSFAYPRTAADASREIDRLRGARRTPTADRRRELRAVSREMAERRGGSSAVDTDYELEGYGSTASWSTFVEGEGEEEEKERAAAER